MARSCRRAVGGPGGRWSLSVGVPVCGRGDVGSAPVARTGRAGFGEGRVAGRSRPAGVSRGAEVGSVSPRGVVRPLTGLLVVLGSPPPTVLVLGSLAGLSTGPLDGLRRVSGGDAAVARPGSGGAACQCPGPGDPGGRIVGGMPGAATGRSVSSPACGPVPTGSSWAVDQSHCDGGGGFAGSAGAGGWASCRPGPDAPAATAGPPVRLPFSSLVGTERSGADSWRVPPGAAGSRSVASAAAGGRSSPPRPGGAGTCRGSTAGDVSGGRGNPSPTGLVRASAEVSVAFAGRRVAGCGRVGATSPVGPGSISGAAEMRAAPPVRTGRSPGSAGRSAAVSPTVSPGVSLSVSSGPSGGGAVGREPMPTPRRRLLASVGRSSVGCGGGAGATSPAAGSAVRPVTCASSMAMMLDRS